MTVDLENETAALLDVSRKLAQAYVTLWGLLMEEYDAPYDGEDDYCTDCLARHHGPRVTVQHTPECVISHVRTLLGPVIFP